MGFSKTLKEVVKKVAKAIPGASSASATPSSANTTADTPTTPITPTPASTTTPTTPTSTTPTSTTPTSTTPTSTVSTTDSTSRARPKVGLQGLSDYGNNVRKQTGAVGTKGRGGVRYFNEGGKVSSASKRADGCAQRGKTKGKII